MQVQANRAAVKAAREERDERNRVLSAAAQRIMQDVPLCGDDGSPSRMSVRSGLELVEELEPARFAAACNAVLSGHPAVYQALHDYFVANAGKRRQPG